MVSSSASIETDKVKPSINENILISMLICLLF
jgi:hypothetical protein